MPLPLPYQTRQPQQACAELDGASHILSNLMPLPLSGSASCFALHLAGRCRSVAISFVGCRQLLPQSFPVGYVIGPCASFVTRRCRMLISIISGCDMLKPRCEGLGLCDASRPAVCSGTAHVCWIAASSSSAFSSWSSAAVPCRRVQLCRRTLVMLSESLAQSYIAPASRR